MKETMRLLENDMYGELVQTPLGPISFMVGPRGVQRLVFAPLTSFKETLPYQGNQPSWEGFHTIKKIIKELNEYLEGRRENFSIMVDWLEMSDFQRRVLQVTCTVPYGELLTYGDIARQMGQPGAARAVGRALGANPLPIIIPCHRVIGSNHGLHGYLGGLARKTFLLALEGHRIENHRVIYADVE